MVSESQFISAVYIGYVLSTVAVFARRPSLGTALGALGLGWMALPVEVFAPHTITPESFTIEVIGAALPSTPLVTKGWIPPCAVLLALAVARVMGRWRPERPLRLVGPDIAIALFCGSPLLPWLADRIDFGPALSQCLYLSGAWGASWLIGRVLLGSAASRMELARLLAWSGIALLPIAVVEGVRPPWLYGSIYGAHPFQVEGAIRYLGYRPMGLFEHGNQYGIWIGMTALAALWLWLNDQPGRPRDALVAAVLGLATLASQSVGAVVLVALGAGWLVLTPRLRRAVMILSAVTLCLGAPAYLSGRVPLEHWAINTPLGQAAVGKLREVGRGSIAYRVRRDQMSLPLIFQAPLAGYGVWDWWRPLGSHPWGLPLLIAGQYGVVAAVLLALALVAGAVRRLLRAERDLWALVVLIAATDAWLNSYIFFPAILASAALATPLIRRSARPREPVGESGGETLATADQSPLP